MEWKADTVALYCESRRDYRKAIKHAKKGKLEKKDIPLVVESMETLEAMIEELARKAGLSFDDFLKKCRNDLAAQKAEKGSQDNTTIEKGAASDSTSPAQPEKESSGAPEETPEKDVTSEKSEDKATDGNNSDEKSTKAGDDRKTIDGRAMPKGGKPKGSGKRPAGTLGGVVTPLGIFGIAAGGRCNGCKTGTLHPVAPGIIVRIDINSTFVFHTYEQQKLRCNDCGQTICAEVPAAIKEDHISGATPKAAATILVMRYVLGIPNLRTETLTSWLGSAMSDSRLWDISRESVTKLMPLRKFMSQFVADADVQTIDDGSCRIIYWKRMIDFEIEAAKAYKIDKHDLRTGVQTTVALGSKDGQTVVVYISGRKHQGENAYDFDQARRDENPFIRMSDAASKTTSTHPFPERDERGFILASAGKVIVDTRAQIVHCLTHLRNKFDDVREHAPELVEYVTSRISAIYDVDDEAAAQNLSWEQRLELHQKLSTPLVEEIRARLNQEIVSRTWLPKEPIGAVLNYAKKHLDACTGFLRIPGCPLDSNSAERGVYTVVRHREASVSYQTPRGSDTGDVVMTLANSARLAGQNPIVYLARCLEFPEDIATNPQLWMPWNHQARWEELREQKIAEREASPERGYITAHRVRRPPKDSRVPAASQEQRGEFSLPA